MSPLPLSVCLFVCPFRILCYCSLNSDNVLAQLSSLIDSKTLHQSFSVLTKGTPSLTFMSYSGYVKYPWSCYKGHTVILIHRASVLSGNIHASPEMFIWLAVHSFMPTMFCSYGLWIELLTRRKPFPYAILDDRISIMLSCQRALYKELRYGARWKHKRYMKIITETIVMIMGHPRACFEKWLSAYISSGALTVRHSCLKGSANGIYTNWRLSKCIPSQWFRFTTTAVISSWASSCMAPGNSTW